jgi:hypothetical protein
MLEELTFVVYTHYDYDDILSLYLYHHNKYIPQINITLCSNRSDYIIEKYKDIYPIEKIIEYNDSEPFSNRIVHALNQITTKYILFNQDINIIYGEVSSDFLESTVNYMTSNNVDQMRLVISGITNPIFEENVQYHSITNGYFMSVMSGIWKRESFYSIMHHFKNYTYRDIECGPVQEYVKYLNNMYVSSIKDRKIKTQGHYMPFNYPIYHITSNGKWQIYNSQRNYLMNIFNILNINKDLRDIEYIDDGLL